MYQIPCKPELHLFWWQLDCISGFRPFCFTQRNSWNAAAHPTLEFHKTFCVVKTCRRKWSQSPGLKLTDLRANDRMLAVKIVNPFSGNIQSECREGWCCHETYNFASLGSNRFARCQESIMHPQFMNSIAPTKSVARFIGINRRKIFPFWLESLPQLGTACSAENAAQLYCSCVIKR